MEAHRAALRGIGVADGDRRYNLTWHDWLNLESLVDISRVITVSALARENSRGAHFREDFPEPGDLHASRYTRVSAWTAICGWTWFRFPSTSFNPASR